MSKFKVALERAREGSLFDIYQSVMDARDAGATLSEAVIQELADRTLARYQKHLAAAFRRYGVNIGDDEVIDSTVLLRVINERAGTDIQHLTPDALMSGFDSVLSARASTLLGVEVSSVQNFDAVKAALVEGAVQAVQSGRATQLVSRALIKKVQAAKAWKNGNVPKEDRKEFLSRWYQKKYRRTHKGEWRDAVA